MMRRLLLERSVDKQRRIYRRLYERHGPGHRALHWTSRANQRRRFEALSRVGDLCGCRVLDLGCGLGDLLDFMLEETIACHYTGYDVVPEFIYQARRRFPGVCFEERNILVRPPACQFDYVFASGLFAFGSRLFLSEMLQAAYSLCDRAFAFNIHLPIHGDVRFLDISVEEVKRECQKLLPERLVIHEGYLEQDVTFILYKQ